MKKRLLVLALMALGFSANTHAQSTPLYMGYYYSDQLTVIDTATYTETDAITMTSDAGTFNGCYGLSLEPASGDMYILYQIDEGSETARRLGIVDVATGAVTDIGILGNMNDIGFVNGQLYATTGSYVGQAFHKVDKTDASSDLLLVPSNDNEACGLIHNYYTGDVYYVDEDHFSLIDLETNTETLADAFPSFPEELNSIVMLTETSALVGNYDELYLFDFETFSFTYILNRPNNIHGMAFGQYPLVVAIDGPNTYCSSTPSPLSTTETGDTYQWFMDDVLIDGATEAIYLATASGAYSCEVDGEMTKNAMEVEVIASPVVSFTATPNPVYLGLDPTGTVDFVNTTPTGDEFWWDFDNGFNSATENPTFPFITAGEYDVVLMVTDTETGCTDEAMETVVVSESATITENQYQFEVYPTPAKDFVTVAYSGAESNLVASVIDLNGKTVQSTMITPNGNTGINVSELNAGMYLLRITSSDEEVAVYRIVKQ